MTENRQLGAASTRWSDWVGTAAADDAPVAGDRPSLYETCGLDRDRWQVVGFDFELASGELAATVYAFPRDADHGIRPDGREPVGSDVDGVVAALGHLPVSAFLLDHRQSQSLLSASLGRVSLRLVARDLRNDLLVVDVSPNRNV